MPAPLDDHGGLVLVGEVRAGSYLEITAGQLPERFLDFTETSAVLGESVLEPEEFRARRRAVPQVGGLCEIWKRKTPDEGEPAVVGQGNTPLHDHAQYLAEGKDAAISTGPQDSRDDAGDCRVAARLSGSHVDGEDNWLVSDLHGGLEVEQRLVLRLGLDEPVGECGAAAGPGRMLCCSWPQLTYAVVTGQDRVPGCAGISAGELPGSRPRPGGLPGTADDELARHQRAERCRHQPAS
jgi:hypothetical protein